MFKRGDYAGSLDQYGSAVKKNAESDVVNFNLGTAYYKTGAYDKALGHLQKGVLSEQPQLRQKAHYNTGNAFYKFGIGQEEENLDLAIVSLEKSLAQYDSALKIDPKDVDARYNQEYVSGELERLRKRKKQSPQPQKQEKKSQDKKESQPEVPLGDPSQKSAQEKSAASQPEPESQKQPSQPQENKKEQSDSSETRQEELAEEKKIDSAANPAQAKPSSEEQGQESAQHRERSMAEEQAQRLLDHYQNNEEPKGLLNFIKRKGKEVPVLRDW